MDDHDSISSAALKEVSEAEIIGLGSGSTVAHFTRALGIKSDKEKRKISVIPSSTQIQLVAEESGLEVVGQSYLTKLEFTIDGADQIDQNLRLLKGGGGALFRERILIEAAPSVIILATENKFFKNLSKPVTVETSRFAISFVEKKLQDIGGIPKIRNNDKGYPIITDNGNLIFDVDFGSIYNPEDLYSTIKYISGVVEVGLFMIKPIVVFKSCKGGEIQRLQR